MDAKGDQDARSGRPSASADSARRAEIARVRAMTPLERMALALSLGQRRLELERRREQDTSAAM